MIPAIVRVGDFTRKKFTFLPQLSGGSRNDEESTVLSGSISEKSGQPPIKGRFSWQRLRVIFMTSGKYRRAASEKITVMCY